MSEKHQTKEELQAQIQELEARVAAAEKKVEAGEEAALQRVCKAMEIDPITIETKEGETPEKVISMHVPFPVRVNSRVYFGLCHDVPMGTKYVIDQALGARRMRLLNELTSNSWTIRELSGGGMATVRTGAADAAGERIA